MARRQVRAELEPSTRRTLRGKRLKAGQGEGYPAGAVPAGRNPAEYGRPELDRFVRSGACYRK